MTTIHSCNFPNCEIKEKLLKCNQCSLVYYCSKDHQKDDWKNHSIYCHALLPRSKINEGYPEEELINVFNERKNENAFTVPADKLKKPTTLPIIFKEQLKRDPCKVGSKMIVDEQQFKEQFAAFTSNMFSNWTEELWKNMLCAGGAVLASLLPLENNYERRSPPVHGYAHEFSIRYSQKRRNMQEYLTECRWPSSDIDLFCYGLSSPESATKKLDQILKALKARVGTLHGDGVDVAFIRTTNSVTIDYGAGRRIQFILRLFDNVSSILNTFDIDCCCVGYDGTNVLMTGRASFAITNRVNCCDLSLRGDAFESRLIKYAERGFALAVPGLDLKKVDRKYLKLEQEKSRWGDYMTFKTDDWEKWGESRNLERLMLADYICKNYGCVEELFPNRKKGQPRSKDDIDGFNIITNGNDDTYPTRSKWRQVWPATMQLSALTSTNPRNVFRIEWHKGPMARKPLSFEEWSANVFDGTKKEKQIELEEEARRKERMARFEARKKENEAAAEVAEAFPPTQPVITETGKIPISLKLQNALKWVDIFKKNLPMERNVTCDDAFTFQRALHPQTPIVYNSNSAAVITDSKIESKAVEPKVKSIKKTETKEEVQLKQTNVQLTSSIKARVYSIWMVSRVYYELRDTNPEILEKLHNIFSEGRQSFQHQKKVADNVYEGRLSAKARFFFVELEPDKYIITSVCLNHKGFTKIISNSAELGRLSRGLEMPEVDGEEFDFPFEKEMGSHAIVTQKVMTDFHAEREADTNSGYSELRSSSWCLPRVHQGNLDMLFELCNDFSAQPLLTRRQAEVIQQAITLGCMLTIKGSAGNGKTTVLSEITSQLGDEALLVLPNEALKAQVLKSYPNIKVVTLRERLDVLTPPGTKKVTFGEYIQAKKEQLEKKEVVVKGKSKETSKKATFDAHKFWSDRFEDPFYLEWKVQTNRKDENDLWDHMVMLNKTENLKELEPHFCSLLIDEAQSMTSIQLRIIALSSGRPQTCIVGMDSKQTIGRKSAGRKAAVKAAISEAFHNSMNSKKKESFEDSTATLTTNFRCPVTVLQTLDIVITSWLKKYFKDRFDDFYTDTCTQSSLWDAPPIFIFKSPQDVAILLRYMTGAVPVLLKKDGAQTPAELVDRVVAMELSDFRGMEFDDLLIMSSPLSNSIDIFKNIIRDGSSSKSAGEVCDVLCLLIVMLTRARSGCIWIEKDIHHPLISSIKDSPEGRKCIKICGISDIKDTANTLLESRKDLVDDEDVCTGKLSVIRMLSKMMNVINERIELYQSINNQCMTVIDLISRLSRMNVSDQEDSLTATAKASNLEVNEICNKCIVTLERLPDAILRLQLLQSPDIDDNDNIANFGDLMISSFLDTVNDMDPEPPSSSLTKLHNECAILAKKFGKKLTTF